MSETQGFTSWTDLKAQLLKDLADPSFRKMGQYSIASSGSGGSRSVSYRSLKDLLELLKVAELEVMKEVGADYHGRTNAANGGRG
jgi:hypothetical protein